MLQPCAYTDIAGWQQDDHQAALKAFHQSAQEILTTGHGFKRQAAHGGTREIWLPLCASPLTAKDAKSFFETNFTPHQVIDDERPQGLYTGYYEPEAQGSRTYHHDFPVAIYQKPPELVAFTAEEQAATGLTYGQRASGLPKPFFTRQEIEQGALAHRGLEICHLKSWVDAFFIHVQGNGRVRLQDGSTIRLSFAAKNGRPYSGIGAELLKRGIGTPQTMSMQLLRQWMAEHPEQTREFLWTNQSFIFFTDTQIAQAHLGAIGAAKVNLTPKRSLAVDRQHWMFGTPLFVQTHQPPEAGKKPFNHLMIAQDTGTAIKGLVRGDVYWGWGDEAALNAGHMKSPGKMFALLPNALAQRLPS